MQRYLLQRVSPKSSLLRLQRRAFRKSVPGVVVHERSSARYLPLAVGVSAMAIGGCGIYLYHSRSLEIAEYARDIKLSADGELRWRDAVANALVAIGSQESGRVILKRHNWGSTLGNWIKEETRWVRCMGRL